MTHPSDEELALYHARLLPLDATRKVTAHLSACARCRAIVADAARGLAILSNASEPPADLLKHVRARRWAAKGDDAPIGLPFEEAEEIAEVSGRGREAEESQIEDAENGEATDDGGER